MRNKLTNALLSSCLFSNLFGYAGTTNKNMTGLYYGLHGGYDFIKSKINNNIINYAAGEPDLIASHNSSISMRGMSGGLHLGYQYDFNTYLLGVELLSTYSHKHKNKKFISHYTEPPYVSLMDVSVTAKNRYESALRLGYRIMPQLVAGLKLGYARNDYNIPYVNHVVNRLFTVFGQTAKKKVHLNSFVTGVYVEKFLNNNIIIGVGYDYKFSKKKTFEATYMIIPDGVPPTFNKTRFSFKTNSHDFKIRLGYKL